MTTAKIIREFLVYGFATYGAIWTFAESFGAFFEKYKPEGVISYLLIIFISIVVGILRSWPHNIIQINVPNSDSHIEIRFGDIFDHSGGIAIPVNDFFDSELGDHISYTSLHGQFISNKLGGVSSSFDNLISQSLQGIAAEYIVRPSGRNERFPVGTTACVSVNNQKFFLFVLAKTDLSTLKVSSTIHELWDALAELWVNIRNYSNGEEVALPMVGGGLSGIGLPAGNLIDIILISFFYHTKKYKIAKSVVLILPNHLKKSIDLKALKNTWSHYEHG